jgi:MFS family permease
MSQTAHVATAATTSLPWYRQLNGYHWLVLIVATMAWAFDCLNQQIFNLTRKPAMADLLAVSPEDPAVTWYGNWGTSMLLIGWATGGIIFGILGDRIGRAKTLVIMILCYSLSTGLCGLSGNLFGLSGAWVYIVCCFITGVGAGGIFPVACTLVAESLPDRTRPQALGMVQTFSAVGNVSAGLFSLLMIELWSRGVIASQWRWLFSVGIIPALLSIIVARRLREPEVWKRAVAEGKTGKKVGSLIELFGDPRWRPRAIVGLMLAASGVVGLWGIGVFSNDLTQSFVGERYDNDARSRGEADEDLRFVARVIASPKQLETAKQRIQPRDLLGRKDREIDGKPEKDVDARLLYGAALQLLQDGRSVSPENVLGVLDQSDKDRKAQTAAERSRRAGLLKEDASTGGIEEHIERILARQKARGTTALIWAAITLMMFNVGAFFGMYAFARVTQKIGRRPTFAIFFLIAMITTALAFWQMKELPRDLWMVALMGGAQLSVFGGYAIYFPELFPTRLRSTGTSFCYNVGRYVAATGPISIAFLKNNVFAHTAQPFRYAGVAMCSCFLVGLVALLFAPETKGQPLPE